ncbi:MAG: Adenosylhomocysteine nucleosidase [Candidatus Uhrbacteria bacterium GW2011_GWF2_44_350]|uniref:adenosylhomocysteine nucleosidase n=1 Tax=Candidatus Uhrbacteria bacterium GW2011_GWF2_44_350 TaxID=1619000 RepID=A0A0G1LMA0_9BACT|nr:MAG: Adenosylhomocysteine nucleosidase [Candidatus Uhrbacteria bacterium GW2011_GWF2_44_350]HBR80096.1 5'-methylthioadenosine/S-adenosylhomocysteine nucleosidase [Candidatus Uhrbacteria bacterium]HCU32204.1 5'-methylthioadenosine/S-adenosylhomocysteine nucleosidase [Candidatus Uhrbacteria bacterium]
MTVFPSFFVAMPEEIAGWRARSPTSAEQNICVTGVGKVNAACAATSFCLRESVRGSTGLALIVGTAAACDPELRIGDVVIVSETLHHDVDVTALGFDPGQIPFEETWRWTSNLATQEQVQQICRKLGLRHSLGRLITGDRFISDPAEVARLRKTFGAAAIDMETAAVAQVCHKLGPLPWLGIRVISDLADKSAPVDFNKFLPEASKRLADILERLL